jgi:hypothetical protein
MNRAQTICSHLEWPGLSNDAEQYIKCCHQNQGQRSPCKKYGHKIVTKLLHHIFECILQSSNVRYAKFGKKFPEQHNLKRVLIHERYTSWIVQEKFRKKK